MYDSADDTSLIITDISSNVFDASTTSGILSDDTSSGQESQVLTNDVTKSVSDILEKPVFAFREKNCKLSQAYNLAAKRFERGFGTRNLRRDIIQLNPVSVNTIMTIRCDKSTVPV